MPGLHHHQRLTSQRRILGGEGRRRTRRGGRVDGEAEEEQVVACGGRIQPLPLIVGLWQRDGREGGVGWLRAGALRRGPRHGGSFGASATHPRMAHSEGKRDVALPLQYAGAGILTPNAYCSDACRTGCLPNLKLNRSTSWTVAHEKPVSGTSRSWLSSSRSFFLSFNGNLP
jgi:hypothetical protein